MSYYAKLLLTLEAAVLTVADKFFFFGLRHSEAVPNSHPEPMISLFSTVVVTVIEK